jgi:diaminohydroxyphosphoribosylaminopyrimidine deaminase/5-amino-6-(5-phosphoribosylamino)uracil reductase
MWRELVRRIDPAKAAEFMEMDEEAAITAILEAGIARVVAATIDPNPQVSGRGLARLREAGVDVTWGVCHAEAERINEAFFVAVTRGRPFVLLKVATSIDARIAAAPGQRTRLTSHEADLHVHATRAEVDAIMVGADTVLADDPLLTARLVPRERPLLRIVVDWRLRVPLSARVFASREDGPVTVVTSAEAVERSAEHVGALDGLGIDTLVCRGYDLAGAFAALGRRDLRLVLVEGGASLHRACIAAGLADRLHLYVTPHVLGPSGLAWDVGPCVFGPPERVVPLGPDVFIDTHVHRTH